jgi:hypothetical protein
MVRGNASARLLRRRPVPSPLHCQPDDHQANCGEESCRSENSCRGSVAGAELSAREVPRRDAISCDRHDSLTVFMSVAAFFSKVHLNPVRDVLVQRIWVLGAHAILLAC